MLLALWDIRAVRAPLALWDIRAVRAPLVLRDIRAVQAPLVLLVQQVLWDQQVHLAVRDPLVLRG